MSDRYPSRNHSYCSDRNYKDCIEDDAYQYSDEYLDHPRQIQDDNYYFTHADGRSDSDMEDYRYDIESDRYENGNFYFNETQSDWSPTADNNDVYERSTLYHNNDSDWQNSIPYSSLKLCKYSGAKSAETCNCDALHICKYFMLSRCKVPNCNFGHDIDTEHNARVLQKYFPHKPTIQHLRFIICKKENRNETTLPQVCKFYNNEGGCKHEKKNKGTKCPCLHVCRFYVQNDCKFDRGCKRSHDLLSGQPLQILTSYGLKPRYRGQKASEEILDLLDKIAVEDRDTNACNGRRQELKNTKLIKDSRKMTTKINRSAQENSITNKGDFIPLDTKPQLPKFRYFEQQSVSSDIDEQSKAMSKTANGLKWGQGTEMATKKHGQKRKRKDRDDTKRSAKKRKKSKMSEIGDVDTAANNIEMKSSMVGQDPDTNDSGSGTDRMWEDIDNR